MEVVERKFSPSQALALVKTGTPPVLARALAARGVKRSQDAAGPLAALLPYTLLKNAVKMAEILADAIEQGKRLLIVADYDADGATACSIGVRALRAFGANVGYIIPNRLEHGYGLTPEIAQIACNQTSRPDYLITVDNGIASHEGIALANKLGVPVLVTDHHLPTPVHPDALVIVNPNQHGCTFASKALAGCGVMYYVMWALQDELVSRGYAGFAHDFDVRQLLPIVAVGTIADVVGFDYNNRILVNEGILRIRAGEASPGIGMLAKVSGRATQTLATSDVAFGIGPRINAAGRLESMDAGVECLITDSIEDATERSAQLNELNNRRQEIELTMVEEAVRRLLTDVQPARFTAVLHAPDWHTGVIGIVSGRIKEKIWRPTFVLADGKNGEMKGSGRSIPSLRLRDALDMVNTRFPGIILKFGGHDMAAGVTLRPGSLDAFAAAFETIVRELLTPEDLRQTLEVDGPLTSDEMSLDTVKLLKTQVWGQLFTEPVFWDEFNVVEARPVGDGKHLRFVLEKNGVRYPGIKFRNSEVPPTGRIRVAYKLDANTFREETNLQLMVEHFEPAN